MHTKAGCQDSVIMSSDTVKLSKANTHSRQAKQSKEGLSNVNKTFLYAVIHCHL